MLKRSNCVNYPSQNLHNSFEQAAILKKYQRETERYRHASVWNIILGRNDAGVTGDSPRQEIRPPSQKGGDIPRNIAPL
jgi:hypothetical protein